MSALGGVYDNKPANTSGELDVLVKASATLYPGAGIVSDTGYAKPAVLATGLVTLGALKCVRRIVGGSSDGDVIAVVETSIGPNGLRTYAYDNDPGAGAIAQADLPCTCYWVDDHTIGKTSSGASRAGVALSLDADGRVRMRFDQ